MIDLAFVASLVLASTVFPNADLTPGSFCTTSDPDFLELRYAEQIPICKRNVSTQRKRNIMQNYGYPMADRDHYEMDHCIPLNMGGSNSDLNLWPEPIDDDNANPKNKLEGAIYKGLSSGTMTYEYALEEMRKWCPAGE
jgi:hypothetical protein